MPMLPEISVQRHMVSYVSSPLPPPFLYLCVYIKKNSLDLQADTNMLIAEPIREIFPTPPLLSLCSADR